mmetsp:Transcript_30188/g.69206  ORF Transcript_30188/g.69206 Transcript_30188/m.69206 type:complete len:80 (-) Transcript_30188:48-287(-)
MQDYSLEHHASTDHNTQSSSFKVASAFLLLSALLNKFKTFTYTSYPRISTKNHCDAFRLSPLPLSFTTPRYVKNIQVKE